MKAPHISALVCVLGLAVASGARAASRVDAVSGDIICSGGLFGGTRTLTEGGRDSQPALSPDGRTVAFVRGSDRDAALWAGDCQAGKVHALLAPRDDDKPQKKLTGFNSPVFSLDGGSVYVLTEGWVTSNAVHQVNIKTGAEKFVTDANSLALIRTGPYRGFLLVEKHKYRTGGDGSYDPMLVVRPDGKEILTVPGTDGDDDDSAKAAAAWLKAKGWTAW